MQQQFTVLTYLCLAQFAFGLLFDVKPRVSKNLFYMSLLPLAHRLVPRQQVALVARRAVREERLLVEVFVLRHRIFRAVFLQFFYYRASNSFLFQFLYCLANIASVFHQPFCCLGLKHVIRENKIYPFPVLFCIVFPSVLCIPLGDAALVARVEPPAVDLRSFTCSDEL